MEDKSNNGLRMIMGLDVSTRCVGITVASVSDEDFKVLVVTHLRPKIPTKIKGTEALFMKSAVIADELKKYEAYGITDVVIEEPLIGSNNANTASTLLRFNGMISQSVYDTLHVVPEFISSYDARKYACPQLMTVRRFKKNGDFVGRKKVTHALKHDELVLFGDFSFDCAKKLILWNIVSERFPGIQWQYKSNGDLKDENFDASDSLICVLGQLSKEKHEGEEPVVKEWTDHGDHVEYKVDFCGETIEHRIDIEEEEATHELSHDMRESYTNC